MPIRLNLLAEAQAAEEARRRDPLKRAIWAGSTLVALAVLWVIGLQWRLASARAELAQFQTKLLSVEEESKEARLEFAANSQIETRIDNLGRYSTNRFFCANLLDALQHLNVENIRLIQLQTQHTYTTNVGKTFSTNWVFSLNTPSRWEFWKSRVPKTDVSALLASHIAEATNQVAALKGSPVPLIIKTELKTNHQEVAASVDIVKPTSALEQVTLVIKARDYSNPPGRHVDDFTKALARSPYFAHELVPVEGEGIHVKDRAIQPDLDATDTISPDRPFIPFVIECRYRGAYRINE